MSTTLRKILTLCIVHQEEKLLLGMKKRGFGVGRWNGFGGKVDQSETIEEAALRELNEEASITALDLTKLGILDFEFKHKPGEILEVHIFKTTTYTGVVGESEEMRPQWFLTTLLPYAHMWSSDALWYPFFLQNKKFTGKFLFDESDAVVTYSVREVSKLP